MRGFVDENLFLLANFPVSKAGLLGDVYYTILDETGSDYISRTNTDVLERGGGSYGVIKSWASSFIGTIHWDIDGQDQFKANEVININERNIIYSGIGH